MKNGQNALLILNINSQVIKDYTLNLSEFGIKKKRTITEVYSGAKIKLKKGAVSFKIKPHASIFLKI